MGSFCIGETDFGVDAGRSRFDLKQSTNGQLLLTIEVRGSEEVYREVAAGEDSEWSWTLYPPYFYLRDYPVADKSEEGDYLVELQLEDADLFDVALYLIEHNDVEGATIRVGRNHLRIAGQVDLAGKSRDFRIHWEM